MEGFKRLLCLLLLICLPMQLLAGAVCTGCNEPEPTQPSNHHCHGEEADSTPDTPDNCHSPCCCLAALYSAPATFQANTTAGPKLRVPAISYLNPFPDPLLRPPLAS